MGRQTAAADVSDSQLGPVSTFSVQAGKAKIVLSVLKNHASIRVRIRSVTPDLTEVGGTLEEAKALRQEHDELTLKIGEKQAEITALLVKLEGRDAGDAIKQKIEQLVKDAWKDITTQFENRKMLLDQSVAFHSSALQFGKKMSQVEARCAEVPQAQDVETARKLIQQHQELKKGVLEASMTTLQEGQLLLDRIRRMALCADVQNRHATTSGCFYIEQLLLNLQDRKRRLEELWLQRKLQLEQCIQLLLLDQDAGKVTKWLDEVGEVHLAKKDLGDSLDSANSLFSDTLTIDQQFLAAPQTVKRLIGAIDYLTHPVTADKDAVRQRFVALDQRCDNFVSRLNVRRKNVSLSAYFFALAQEALLRLEEIEVLLTGSDLAADSPALAERHTRLLQSILEASIAALHVGRTLLGRVGKDDAAGSGVNAKVTELQERCTKLQGQCTARPAPETQPSEAFTSLLDKFNKLNAWVKYVGQASIDRYSDLGISISDANDFLITHRGLAEDYKTKLTEAKSVVASAEELSKAAADNKDATDLLENAKKLAEQLEKLVALAEKRSKIALSYVVLNKREQQLSIQLRLLEEHLKQEKVDPSLIPEAAIRQREDAFKKVTSDCTEIDRIGKQFLNDINELKTTDQLNTEFVVRGVSLLLSNFADRKEITGDYFEHWKAYAVEGRTFSTQWKQFIQDARKTIDWVMKVEDTFFPKIAGELGSSLNELQQHKRKLEEFKPTIVKAQEETEKHLKTAELLSLRGDTRGQRDQIVNELLKVHTRFQARIGEYRYLLNMATKFFENLTELDKLIATTEKEYASEELPKEVSAAEDTLRQHNADKTKLKQLIEFSSEEADQIVIRVRQQDSEEVAKDEVQRVLQLSEEKRKLWEQAWDDHKKRLEQCLQVSQFYFDLKQLQDELDELQRQLDTRQGSYGNSLSSVRMIIQAFVQLEKLADLIGERFKDFVGTADKMIKDRHYDSRRIRHEVDETEKRWTSVYNTIKNYRIALEASTKFFDTMVECEGWLSDAGQFLHGISRQAPECKSSGDVDKLIGQIQKYKTDGAMQQDGRLNNMERIATDLYGSVLGPEKMQHVLDKNQEMFNAFIKAIEDLMILRNNLINTEQILANVGAVVEKKAPRQPRFVQPLQNAEITEGQRFTFECRLECDTLAPVIQWLKDNEPVKGFVPSYKDGICSLTIEETMLRDSGSFVCQAKTEAGSTETSATLRVKELQQKLVGPEFSKQLKPLEVPEGTSVLLECYVSGIPFPTITWSRDDVPIANSAEHVITIDGGCCYLKIRKLNKEHTGLYKCKASNAGGDAITSASLTVISVKKPEFTQPLKDARVDEAKSIRLECRYTGDPAPQIQWLFNDSPILPSALFKIIVEENFTALEIHEVFPEDCGNYTATAKNLGGEARTTCLLSLIGVLPTETTDGAGKRPEFIQRLTRCDVLEGNRAKLECVVTGIPEPEVLWYHNDKPLKKSKDFDFSYHNGRCVLAINEVYLEDSGEYLCTARNVHGMARTECRLVVEPLSEFSDTGASLTGEVPPKFTQLLKDIEGVEGELVRFECRVIGFPTPIIKWYCGRNQLSTSPEFEITSENELQKLTIPAAHKDDAGNYMVKATNNAGIAKCYATLIVKKGGDKHAMKMRLIESSHSVQTSVIEGHKPPEVVKSFHDLHVRPGQPCTMEVVIVGKPKPKIQWLFNNETIISPDYKISALGDVYSLHIPEVFDEDAGRFSVIAENDAGKAWCSALLVVVDMSQLVPGEGSPPDTPQVPVSSLGYGPPPVVPRIAPQKVSQQFQPVMLTAELPIGPEFPEPLRNVAVDEGGRATFEIPIAGRPEPMIRWFKDGRQLIGGTGGLEISFSDGRARLTIPSALEKDSGRYTCSASNVAGEASSTAELVVKASAARPQFTQRLEGQTVTEGQSVRFQVRVSGKPLPEVTWYREGMPIVSSPDFTITQEGELHTLYIPEVFPEDSGKFTVRVVSTAGQAESTADLLVQGSTFTTKRSFDLEGKAPKFLKGLSNRSAQVGQRITLECAIPPYPAPEKVQWFHNEVELFISPQHQISYSNGNCLLSITKVVHESRGKYACTVLVNGLPTSTDMQLDVVGEPEYDERDAQIPQFRDRLKHVKYEEGQDVVFVCQVAAHPPPNIQWFHHGRLIRPSTKFEMKLTKDGVCSLRIRSVGPQDVGIYTCSATNVVGQEYSSAELYIPEAVAVDETSYVSAEALRRMMHSPGRGLRDRDTGGGVSEQFFKPQFRKVPTDLEVPEGHMARFDSIVAGRPIPDMLWYREGTQVFDDRLHKIVINEEGINSLIIDATSVSDNGLYTCIARNRAGEDQFQVRLNILGRQAAAPPRFQARLGNQSVTEGQAVTFTVEVDGYPPPMLSWQKDGYHITSSERYQIHTEGYRSTLYIPVVGIEDNAWFQCTAAGPGGGVATNRVKLIVLPSETQISQRTYVQSVSPALQRQIPTPVGRTAPSPDPRQISFVIAPTTSRASPWQQQQQQQYAEEIMSRTAVELQTKRTEFPVSSEAAPQLIEPMKDQQVVEGVTSQFRCKIYSATEPRYEWFFNNHPIHHSHKYHIEAGNGFYALTIAGITVNDAGVYKCVVSNQGGEVTCIAHLRVGSQLSRLTPAEHFATGPPQVTHFAKTLSDVTTTIGSSANFEVSVGNQPVVEVQWLFNGRQIQPSENFQVLRSNGTHTLRIKQVTPDAIGTYTCRLIGPHGSAESSARLTTTQDSRVLQSFPSEVREPVVVPAIVETKRTTPVPVVPAPESPKEGDTQFESLQSATGTFVSQPPAVVEEVVHPVAAESKTITVPDLSSISSSHHQQTTTTVVTTGVPGESKTIVVPSTQQITQSKGVTTIVEVSQGDAPRFTQPIQPCVVVEGQSCTFSAVVVGDPWPEITWLKEKEDLVLTDRHKTAADAKTGSVSLTILNCQPHDTGVYSCRATNAAGRATCTANVVVVPPNVEVTVTEKTMSVKKEKVTTMGDQEIRVVESSPTFKEALPPLLEVNEGEPVRLQCQVSAEPEPNVSWFFNGNKVTSTHRVTLTLDKTLTVLAIPSTTLADTGEYICTAKNTLGEAHTKTFLRVKKLEKEPVPVVPATQPSSSKPISELLVQPIASGSAVEVSLPMPPMALTEPCSVIPLTSPKPESPKFLVPLRNHTVKEGDALKFNVQYRGNPTPRITWYINGKTVQEDGDFQVTVDGDRGESTLTIREVFPDDEGEYTCKAVNTVGTAISNSHLFVIVSSSSEEERTSMEKTTIEQETIINRELWKNIRNEQETIIIDQKPRTQVIEVTLGSKNNYQSTLETNLHRDVEDSTLISKNHFIPIPVIEQREKERSVFVERSTNEHHQVTEVIGGGEKIFSETVAIDRTDQGPEQTLEFQLAPERKTTKTSELRVHRTALPKGMKMEQLLLLERNVKKHEISESLLNQQVFSETVAIDTSDHKPQTLEIELKQHRSSELLVHQKALPKGVRMEAEVLESLRKTSRLDLARSKYIEAIENQRQEILLNLEGSAPRFVKEIQSQKVMDGGKVKFNAKVIGNPMPEEVSWYHDERIISNNPDFHVEYDKKTGETTLLIGELFPQDAGLYECLATNVYGQAVTQGTLIVEAYEYVADSEESWTSQGESNISTSSAVESLQKLHIESKELVTQIKQDVQVERITERREEEHIHITDVKWCKPKHVEPVVEIVKHEGVTDLTVESRAVTAPQTAIPQVTTQVSVRASNVSRVHPLQEVTKMEEVREFDETDSSLGSRLNETQQITSPLASPAVGKMTEAMVSTLLERMAEEHVTHLDTGMATPEIPISLAISGLELVKVAKTVGMTFIKTDQLPAQTLEATHTIGEVSLESGRTDVIQVELGTSRARDVPSSWVVPLVAQENAENVVHLVDQLPSPQKTEEKETVGVLIKPDAFKAQSLVTTVVEYHSEGEEEELFHEAAEPSICGRAVVQENLVHVSVRPRPFSLAQQLEGQLKVEATQGDLHELVKETPRREEITVSLESAFKKLGVPSQIRPQVEFINVAILREEETGVKEVPKIFSVPQVIAVDYASSTREEKPVNQVFFIEERASPERISDDNKLTEASSMISVPQLIASEFDSSKKEDKPVTRATMIEDRLSPEKIILVRSSNYDEISMILPAPEVIRTEFGSSTAEGKTVTRVQTVEDRLSLESALDGSIARVEDISVVLPTPELIHFELAKSTADEKPVMRTVTVEDRNSPDRITISQTVNLDELSLNLPAGEVVSVELVSSTREGKPVTRSQIIEDRSSSVLTVDELNKEPVSQEFCQESLETFALDKAEVLGARPSLVQVIEEQLNLLGAGELNLDVTRENTKTEVVESLLTRSSVQPKPFNQVLMSQESQAQEGIHDEGETNFRELSMTLSLPEVVTTEFVCYRKEDKPVNRTQVVEDRLSPEKTIVVKSVNLDEISMILASPELIKTELGSSLVEGKPVTRVQTTEEQLSLEAMSEHVPTRADDLAMTLPAPELISSELARSTAEGKPVTRAIQIEDRLSPDRVTFSNAINLNDLALTLPGGQVASVQFVISSKEDKPVSRTRMVEDLNLPEDVLERGKDGLASLLTMLSAAEVESPGLVPASKEDKPVTQALIQEEQPEVERVSERAALRVDELAVIMPAPKVVSVELENSVSTDKLVSKVVATEDRVSPERIVEGSFKGTDDISFTVSAQLEPSVDLETKVIDYIPVNLTQTREDHTALERVAERSVTIDELLVTAFTSLMSGAELASAIRDFLISQVRLHEEQTSSETVSEKCSSVSELLVSALSSQITAAELAFAIREKLISHARTIEERTSPERVLEKTSNTNELVVSAPSSQISAADLAFALREKLISQVRIVEERLSPERVLEKSSNTNELIVNALSSQISAADMAFALREKLISQVRIVEERLSPERVLEKSSNTNELIVNALSSQISAADLALAMREKLISQVRFTEEKLSPERVLEKRSNTNELIVNALSSQISAADLALAMREKLISQVRFTEEKLSPERVLEKTSGTSELLVSALSSQISAADLAFALRERLISQVRSLEERLSPERTLDKSSNTSELLVNALSSQISAADLAIAVRERLISQAALVEERMSPERILEKTSNTSELLVNALSSQISAAELAFAVRERLISLARMVEERNSPDRVSDKSSDINELLVSALSSQMRSTELTQATREKILTMVEPVEERKSPEKVLDRTDFGLAGQTMTLPSADEIRSVLTWGRTTDKATTLVQPVEERTSPERISEGIRDAAHEQSGYVSEIPMSSEHTLFVQKHRSQTLVLPQVIRLHVEAAAKLDSVPDERPLTSDTKSTLALASVKECAVYMNEETTEDKEIVTEITVVEMVKKEREPVMVESGEKIIKVPTVQRTIMETEIETELVTEEWEDVREQGWKGSEGSESETHSIDEQWEEKVTTEMTTERQVELERKEPEELSETGSLHEQWEETLTTATTTERQVAIEQKEPEDLSETGSLHEQWEETVTTATTTERQVEVEQKEPEDLSETGSMHEEWEETLTTETTTKTQVEIKQKEPEELSETGSMHEEWEETLTTATTTETQVEIERKEPEDLSESESMHEEWEETLTTQTTTVNQIQVKQPEKEELKETESMEEEWVEVVKTTTITEQDILLKKEPEPEVKDSDSETQSLLEEWEETLRTETTTETDVTVERQASRESLSETESMHEEWEETKKTTTIVEKDILLGEMQRVIVDKKAVLVCKEFTKAKEVDGTQLEGVSVDVTDSRLDAATGMKREEMTRERTIETETTYGEYEFVSKDDTEVVRSTTTIPLAVPSVGEPLQPVTVIDGTKATLTCRVVGYPEPDVKWYVDGMEIKQSTDFKMTYENGFCSLVITGVLPEDEGEYCMRATNEFGSCKSTAYMTVKQSTGTETTTRQKRKAGMARNSSGEEVYSSSGEEASSGWTVEESKVFKEFKNLEIDVSLKRKGVVDSKYQWLQEQSARQGALHGSGELHGESGFLETRTDITEGKTDFKQAIVASSHAGQAPVFVTQLESRDVFESTPVKLECDVKGFPQPEVTWFQDGKKIFPDDHMKLSYNHGRCTLFIDRVTIDDEAEYVCEARNEHGVASSWAELLVEKLIEGLEQLVMEEFYELEIEMQFKWKTRTEEDGEEQDV